MKRVRLSYPYVFVWMPIFIIAPMLFVLYYALFRDGHFTFEFVKQVFEHIHEESVRQQVEIVNQ